MEVKTIQKYKTKNVNQLIKIAERWCNSYIRKRDEGRACISCGKYLNLQAGHFYPAGWYPNLKFNEKNINGQCLSCKYFKSGNLQEYRKNLNTKIGEKKVKELDFLAAAYKRNGWKWDRFYLIEKIEYYKTKVKTL